MDSFLKNEILEQPTVLLALLDQEQAHISRLAAELNGKFQYILIAARGTSDNAARYAQYLFQIANHIPVSLATSSVFSVYKQAPNLDGALVIGISQSGQSPDIVSVLQEARRQGRPSIAITNTPKSPLADFASAVINMHAGPEKAVAATKTYTASLLALALFAQGLSGSTDMLAEIRRTPRWVKQTLDTNMANLSRIERYRFMEHAAVISRGYNYATCFEIALKIKELTGVTTAPYSSADFLHGPIASVKPGYPVIAIAQSGAMYADILDIIGKASALGAELLVISDEAEAREKAHLAFTIPAGIPEWLSPLVTVLPGQLFAWQLALARGLNADSPKGLSKVTETT